MGEEKKRKLRKKMNTSLLNTHTINRFYHSHIHVKWINLKLKIVINLEGHLGVLFNLF